MFCVSLFKLLTFDVIWSFATTFSAFSFPLLWVNTFAVALIITIPYGIFRRKWLQIVVFLLMDCWLIANLMYSRTYFAAIPLSSYNLAGNLSEFTASVVDSLRYVDLLFPLSTILAIIWSIRHHIRPIFKPLQSTIYCGYIVLLALIAFAIEATNGGFKSYWAGMENANYHSCCVPIFTLFGQIIHDMNDHEILLSAEQKQEVANWLTVHSENQALSPISSDKQNIVLIICESLESWVVNLKVEGKEITPNINRYLSDSTSTIYAPHVLSQVGNGRSIDGQLLINAGLLPPVGKVYSIYYATNKYGTLNQALKTRNGAKSCILTVDKTDTWNQGAVARAFGFDSIVASDKWVNDEKIGSRKKLGDRSFMAQAVDKMKRGEIWRNGDNKFLQIVTYSGHNPFVLQPELDKLKLTGKYPETMANYMTMAHYTDSGIGLMLDYLKSRPDYDKTIIVITGDHEGLASYRNSLAGSKECKGIVSDKPYVPFIVLNSPVALQYKDVMGQVDIYPTLLQLMGLTDYTWHGMGYSILSPAHPGFAVGSQSQIEGDTTVCPQPIRDNVLRAKAISDRIITYNLE
jgi:phosphoglycerol transferase MdoB-like AlkP superfamily enzyme